MAKPKPHKPSPATLPGDGTLTPNVVREVRADPKAEPTCATCPFFKKVDAELGFCRRFPPTVANTLKLITANGYPFRHPLVMAADVCGEHPDFRR